jgi:hypothetical protein
MRLKNKYIYSNIKKKKGYLLCSSDEEERGRGTQMQKITRGVLGVILWY